MSACAKEVSESVVAAPQESAAKDLTWQRALSRQGLYRIEIATDYSMRPLGQMHAWNFRVMLADGTPITPQQFAVSGTMPGHGHGMTTFPRSSAMPTPGQMQVKGMKFHMSGRWKLHINIVGLAGTDSVDFDVTIAPPPTDPATRSFSQAQLALLKSLSFAALPAYDGDPSNRFSGNAQAVALGKAWFFDVGLSSSNKVSCATCHKPDSFFTDNLAKSIGSAPTPRHAPSLIGAAYSNWFYWDGRRDSLWAQALSPIETAGEMDSTRVDVVRYVLTHPEYSAQVEALAGLDASVLAGVSSKPGTGPLSNDEGQRRWQKMRPPKQERINTAFANVGKIIAAYEETLLPTPSRFDRFVETLVHQGETPAAKIFSASEIRGAQLFIDSAKTDCMRCHNGPLLSNQEFHNIATALSPIGTDSTPDAGRAMGLNQVKADPFNCLGLFSDAREEDCITLQNVRPGHLDNGAFKTPTLRNIAQTAPYMHHGDLASLEAVLQHYRFPPEAAADSHEIPVLTLNAQETTDLIAFLKTL